MATRHSRRQILRNLFTGSAAIAVAPLRSFAAGVPVESALKGNVRHSVCRWCFNDLPIDQLCKTANEIGLAGIDLVGPKDWPVLKQHNLISTMCNGAEISLVKGWNDPQYHSTLIRNYTEHINLVADAGFTNLICFSGNRNGMDDETGLKNCAEGLKQVIGLAEKRGVVLHMELLNSKINHKDYMCDRTPWGAALCEKIGSPNFKLLYDIYHMQIDEGDVINTIRAYSKYIGHYHTAGVPGRHEIDDTQELYYPAIMRAIVATGHKGFVAQEFMPAAADKIGSLKNAVRICDV
ncbi:hydroxypyruvate isomerase family protein [Sediminibacterium ginsengisoli]|uniref:Hydroxypyruvate isomerase n=1 Tax=Sediminibacterium ginsengisoli TaxID=413434 RepID=A0A1T4M2U6_9BACT|nr:TIM barrel protein [Sediminibacterium ginsengisoli]SJZ61283.1 hydroxypyruvate isomerase [Sediminibacterium ginsengisoli]